MAFRELSSEFPTRPGLQHLPQNASWESHWGIWGPHGTCRGASGVVLGVVGQNGAILHQKNSAVLLSMFLVFDQVLALASSRKRVQRVQVLAMSIFSGSIFFRGGQSPMLCVCVCASCKLVIPVMDKKNRNNYKEIMSELQRNIMNLWRIYGGHGDGCSKWLKSPRFG